MKPPLLSPSSRQIWSVATLALAASGLIACSSNQNTEDELDAILKDGDLTQLSRGALTAPAPVPAPPGMSGGLPIPGGPGGSAGSTGGPGGAAGMMGGGAAGTMGGAAGSGPSGMGGFIADGGSADAIPATDGGLGMGGSTGGGGSPQPFPQAAQGLWQFDDCNPFRTDLSDSSFNGHTAFRSVSAACAPGVQNQGLAIDEADDLVYVPDQPSFTFDNGVTVAAWVDPTQLGGIRTIFRKREGGTSTFVLLSNGRDYQFVIHLDNGRAAAVSARATLNTFTHVAATYDGRELRLYLNGALAAHTRAVGRLSAGAGPLLMGNDAFGRRMAGTLDNVFFDINASTPEQIARLTCVPHPSTLVAVPAASDPVPPGTEVTFDVQLTNNSCDPVSFQFNASAQTTDLTVSPSSDFPFIAPGATDHIALSVTSSPTIQVDDYPVTINAFDFSSFNFLSTTVTYSVLGTPCSIRPRRELEIRDVSVVDDPVRTGPGGAWTFGKLMENMAATPDAAPAMVEALLSTWLTDQPVNGFTVAARPLMQDLILSPFPRTPDGQLDLSRAPFRLLAIANRIDLQDLTSNSAGEGRFVFGVLDPFGNPLQLTMIVEYNIPASSAQDVTDLANAWHGLSALPFPSEAYNAALQAVTERFTARNAAPGRVNGSALGQIRSNDFFTLGEWEFREFHLSAATGQLQPAALALTPDRSFNNSSTLADYINANESSILLQKHTVPASFEGQPFQAGSMITDFFTWNAPGVNPEAREKFGLNTCNGCHTSTLETNTFVFQVAPRGQGQESVLSPFLMGTQVFDGFSNLFRNFNELGRRSRLLHGLICPDEPLPPPPPETTPAGGDSDGGVGGPDGGMRGTGGTGGSAGGGGSAGKGGTGAGGGIVPPPPPPLPPPPLPPGFPPV
jgi:Concanavalin A-like lectin/glucanases superfamily